MQYQIFSDTYDGHACRHMAMHSSQSLTGLHGIRLPLVLSGGFHYHRRNFHFCFPLMVRHLITIVATFNRCAAFEDTTGANGAPVLQPSVRYTAQVLPLAAQSQTRSCQPPGCRSGTRARLKPSDLKHIAVHRQAECSSGKHLSHWHLQYRHQDTCNSP